MFSHEMHCSCRLACSKQIIKLVHAVLAFVCVAHKCSRLEIGVRLPSLQTQVGHVNAHMHRRMAETHEPAANGKLLSAGCW